MATATKKTATKSDPPEDEAAAAVLAEVEEDSPDSGDVFGVLLEQAPRPIDVTIERLRGTEKRLRVDANLIRGCEYREVIHVPQMVQDGEDDNGNPKYSKAYLPVTEASWRTFQDQGGDNGKLGKARVVGVEVTGLLIADIGLQPVKVSFKSTEAFETWVDNGYEPA